MYPTHACKSNNLFLPHDNYGIHIKWCASVRGHLISLCARSIRTRIKRSTCYGNLLTADGVKFSVKHYMPNENEWIIFANSLREIEFAFCLLFSLSLPPHPISFSLSFSPDKRITFQDPLKALAKICTQNSIKL